MLQNFFNAQEISNVQILQLLAEDSRLISNSNFTSIPYWCTKNNKDEFVFMFERARKQLLKESYTINFSEENYHVITHGFTSSNYNHDLQKFKEIQRKNTIRLFERANELICNEIKQNSHLKFTIKQNLARTLCIGNLGTIKFYRTQFKFKYNEHTRTIISLDYFWNLRKRGLLLKGLELDLINMQTEAMSLQKIADFTGCSAQTIANASKNFSTVSYDRVINRDKCIVYIAADSTFTFTWHARGRKYEIKKLAMWTNHESVTDSNLSDLTLLYIGEKDYGNIDLIVKEKIAKFYPKCTLIKVIGDGARWIKKLGYFFNGYYMDKFHYISACLKIIEPLISNKKSAKKALSNIAKEKIYANAAIKNPAYIGDILFDILKTFNDFENKKHTNKIINKNTGEIYSFDNKVHVEAIVHIIASHKRFYYVKSNWKYFLKTCLENIINLIEGLQSQYVTKIVRRHRSATSIVLIKLKLLLQFSKRNQFQLEVLINIPIFNINDTWWSNNSEPDSSTWYYQDMITNSLVSSNIYANAYRTPRMGSDY